MWIFADKTSGRIVYRTGIARRVDGSVIPVLEGVATARAQARGLVLADLLWRPASEQEVALIEANPLGNLSAAIEGDAITVIEAAPEPPALYLVCAISDADNQYPPGVINDDNDSFTFTAELQDEAGNVVPASNTWRIPVRDETGALYDQVAVEMVDGVASASYRTTNRPAKGLHLEETDLNEVPVVVPGVGAFQVKIRQNVNFKVYRSLA